MTKFFLKKKKLIGLDIGTSSIKLAEFVYRDGKPILVKLKLQEIDLHKDTQEAQLEALKNLFGDINLKETQVNVVINCPRSCTRVLTIPYMPKSEIAQSLKWEVRNFTSVSPEEVALDYQILQEITEKGVKKLKVVVACSTEETVDKHLDLLNQVGIKPTLFTQPAFTITNVLTSLSSEKEKPVAVLDIGHSLSELFIFSNQQLSFNRKLPLAGGDFTRGMTQVLVSELGKLQLTLDEAEEVKRKYGLPDLDGPAVLEGKVSNSQLLSLLRPNLEKLIVEIERSFDFYREKEQGAKVERLILLGGGSNLGGLVKKLAEGLYIPVELGNPFQGLQVEESSFAEKQTNSAHRFAQAIGVALSSPGAINLLPLKIKEQTKLLVERSTVKAVVTAVVVILILSYLGMRIRLGVYDKRIAVAQFELNTLALQTETVSKQVFLTGILQERIYWSDALKEIANLIPQQIRLTGMHIHNKTLNLKGEIKSPGLAEEKVLTEFMNTLEKRIFKDVNLVTTKKGSSIGELYTFELNLTPE